MFVHEMAFKDQKMWIYFNKFINQNLFLKLKALALKFNIGSRSHE